MKRKWTKFGLALALLLVLLVVASNSFGDFQHTAAGVESGDAVPLQPCYTIDTSRPEWLAEYRFVYLPVVLREFEP